MLKKCNAIENLLYYKKFRQTYRQISKRKYCKNNFQEYLLSVFKLHLFQLLNTLYPKKLYDDGMKNMQRKQIR